MKLNKHNVKDINKYYENTYVVLPEISSSKVFLLKHADASGVTFTDPIDNSTGLIEFADNFEYTLGSPLETRMRWFQVNSNAFLISRIPARMWKKGIAKENTAIYRSDSGATPLTPELLNASLTARYPSVWNQTEFKKCTNVALSTRFVFTPKTNTLKLFNMFFGIVSFPKKQVHVPKEYKNIPLPAVITDTLKVNYV